MHLTERACATGDSYGGPVVRTLYGLCITGTACVPGDSYDGPVVEKSHVQGGNRGLRRFDAPVLKETRSNNKSFERSILFQGALAWNGQTVEDRNTVNHKAFKKMQKRKLNTILPYGGP